MSGACLLIARASGERRDAIADAIGDTLGREARDGLTSAAILETTDDRDPLLVAGGDKGAVDRFVRRLPPARRPPVWCGVDPRALDGASGAAGFVDLVLDRTEPPIPFDDPAVVEVLRDYQRWYLPLLGDRYLACEALWHDGVRAAGAFVAFRASGLDEARHFAAANPWHRLAPGRLLHLPARVFRTGAPPPGPGTQRSGHFQCGHPHSASEPGVDRR